MNAVATSNLITCGAALGADGDTALGTAQGKGKALDKVPDKVLETDLGKADRAED